MSDKTTVVFVRAGLEGYEIGTSAGFVSIPVWHGDYADLARILEDAGGDVDKMRDGVGVLLNSKKPAHRKSLDKDKEDERLVRNRLTETVGKDQADDMMDQLLCSHSGLELYDGKIILYKYVSQDMRSCHGNTTCRICAGDVDGNGRTVNVLGSELRMCREDVDPDPGIACSTGLHVGTLEFVDGAAGPSHIVLKVAVAPEDVVCVPRVESGKFRVAAYTPVSIAGRCTSFCSNADRGANAAVACNTELDKLLGSGKVQFLREVVPAFRDGPEKAAEALAAAAGRLDLDDETRKKVSSYYYMLPIMQNMPCEP